ncbi:AraC family transcriptional regulator [Ancylobacter terrae]|uniref:AraC family transcriptional regulator n=1 Tax=Ancylobacter sp. sgz301288 TaxID=3342077 RepID=UPI00385B76F9
MSMHVMPPSEGLATRAPAGEMIAARALAALSRPDAPTTIDRAGADMAAIIARLSGTPGSDAAQSATGADPMVRRLSQALAAIEREAPDEQGFAAVYADALRLAIITRVMDLPSAGGDRSDPATDASDFSAPSARQRAASGLQKWRLKRVVAYIDENLASKVTLQGMAEAAGLSRMHFAAQFRATTGERPHEYLLRRRIERAQALMLETRDSLVAIALDVGFQTQAHFTAVFRRFVGDTPYQWRCANRAGA